MTNFLEWHIVVFVALCLLQYVKSGQLTFCDICVLFGWELLIVFQFLEHRLGLVLVQK